ncbi:MAG: hypothetical protein H7061_02690, partial [Bdellovibrionaceae bacterium]|nr:hypothetical protein [Bdellovibrio sp.]
MFLSFEVKAIETQSNSTTVEYIYSSGRGTGFCDGSGMAWYCYDQIKDRAKQDAVRSAYYTCSNKKGRIDEYLASCNYFCTPFSIPQGDHTQFVQCSANCNTRCEIKN